MRSRHRSAAANSAAHTRALVLSDAGGRIGSKVAADIIPTPAGLIFEGTGSMVKWPGDERRLVVAKSVFVAFDVFDFSGVGWNYRECEMSNRGMRILIEIMDESVGSEWNERKEKILWRVRDM